MSTLQPSRALPGHAVTAGGSRTLPRRYLATWQAVASVRITQSVAALYTIEEQSASSAFLAVQKEQGANYFRLSRRSSSLCAGILRWVRTSLQQSMFYFHHVRYLQASSSGVTVLGNTCHS